MAFLDRDDLEDPGHPVPRGKVPAVPSPGAWIPPDEEVLPQRAGDDLAGPHTPDYAADSARFKPRPRAPQGKPWWQPALDWVRTPVALMAIGGALVLVVAGMMLSRPKDESARIAKIRRNAVSFDGRSVSVRGRVCEVFPVGGGYAFNLRQGRDTLVVFTRTRIPVRDEVVTVSGVISVGMMNGEPHQALLENAP
jgi:hypothetical protein